MDDPAVTSVPQNPNSDTRSDSVVRQFVEHWGMMARAWGINPTMGELFALMYITGTDWTAEELRSWLHVSRGNVSMNLRELLAWGVVRKLHRPGERRELYRAETEVWTLFRRILIFRLSESEPALQDLKSRVEPLRQFFGLIDAMAIRLLSLDPREMADLGEFLSDDDSHRPSGQAPVEQS